VIRQFGLRDVLMLRQIQSQGVHFDLRQSLLHASSPMSAALTGYVTRYYTGVLTCVHTGSGEGLNDRGVAQIWRRPNSPEWNLAFLAPELDAHGSAGEIWQKLLVHLMLLGAQEGIRRICARSPEDSDIEGALRRCGFAVVSREDVFVLTQKAPSGALPQGLRPAGRADQWALRELYRAAVPHLVQQMNDGNPCELDGLVNGLGHVLQSSASYVWSAEGQINAHLSLESTRRGYWLSVLVRPECRTDILPYLRYVLSLATDADQKPIYCPVPDHGAGLGWVLRSIGFNAYARQVLLVNHLVARVAVREALLARNLERGAEPSAPLGHALHHATSSGAGDAQLNPCNLEKQRVCH
jgi:hypothetical protein